MYFATFLIGGSFASSLLGERARGEILEIIFCRHMTPLPDPENYLQVENGALK